MRRSRKKRKYVNILPNLLTVGNMYCGLLSIVYTINGQFELAAWLVLLALLFDGSDGHIARITQSTSSFGKELDSLADVITFGVAPAVLVYRSVLHGFEHSGIFIVTVYAITGALRLARYNVQAGPSVKSFTGLPIPAAGCLIAATVLLQLRFDHPLLHDYLPPIFALFILLLAFLMVSTVKYPKQELFLVRRNRAFQYMFIIILLFSIIKLRPTLFIFMIFLAYVTLGPINYLTRKHVDQEQTPQEYEESVP